ncbi:hypothetical protein DY000_02015476 [Brassica cretica]|uniref:Retrotransposon gag domain-containing protein n=1 Tax=Brassica cretica TaxID=69181 RepID=A0ABQ7D606_BRACR|nr:hypothetical protein DY000_02015476 [Brassica cretica]
MYDGTSDPDDHIAQYKQRMLAVALPREFREATMCKGFGSTLIGPALQWYINLPIRSVSSFATLSDGFVDQFASSLNLEKTSDSLYEILQHRAEPFRDYIARFNKEKVLIPKCNVTTTISAFKRGLLPDGNLYKELTKYQCQTMEDVLSRAWAQVKWEEDVASRARTQQKQATRQDRSDRDERSSQKPTKDQGGRNQDRYTSRPLERAEGMSVSTWPDISHLSVSQLEIINALRQMGQQVKWPPKMRMPDSFRNPDLWCEFHRDHENAKNLLSKETPRKSAETKPASPPRQDRLIHVISGGSEISGVSHAAAKKRSRNAKLGLETSKSNRLLLGSDEISFTAKEQEKVLAPHHDALVVSLTIANCLVKRIRAKLVSSSRSTKKQDEIPHFPHKAPFWRPIFCAHSKEVRPHKTFKVLSQPETDDCGPRPRSPKSMTTSWSFQKGGTRLEAGSSMTPGQKISKPPKVPKKIAISIGSLGQVQPTSNAKTPRSEENPIIPGRKLVEKTLGVFDPRWTIPQTMKGGTLSTLSTTPRLIIRGIVELSVRDQPNRWHMPRSHDEQAETGISQLGDEVLRQDRVHELSKSKGSAKPSNPSSTSLKEGSNLNYVTMAVDEQDNPSESTPREAELQRQLDGLQSQQLEQSAEKLTQLESENLVLRDKNQALKTASNKKRRFHTQPSGEAGASGEKAGDTRVRETISSESEPDSEKETSEGAASLQSSLTTYLEQMFSKKLDAMQSMVERLPGVAPPIRESNPGS